MDVIGLAVISIDGCLTRHDEDGVSFSSPEDQTHFRAAVRACDAAVMGRRTFETVRESILGSRSSSPRRIVLTRAPQRYAELAAPGALEFTDESPARLVRDLARQGIERLAVLGGTEVYDLFSGAGLITEWQLTLEPRMFGQGRRLLASPTDHRFALVESRALNESTLLLRYRPR